MEQAMTAPGRIKNGNGGRREVSHFLPDRATTPRR